MDDRTMFYGSHQYTFKKAGILRNNETEGEKLLWNKLRKNQLKGFRFKRQHPVADYIADFYCHKAKLVIEVDEHYHSGKEQILMDENRTAVMNEFGLQVLRFSQEQIFMDIERVLDEITVCLLSRTGSS